MPLFKTGDAVNDQYAGYSTEQLIQIVTDKNETPGVIETARRILLVRGHDYRTKEQKAAQRQVNAINTARENVSTATLPQHRQRPTQQTRPPSGGSFLKGWHWVWIIFIIVRVIGCLVKNGQ